MLARHEGLVVLIAGTIPGELVAARVERVERSLAYAETAEVLEPHPARRQTDVDPRCGGLVYAHIGYEEQRRLKAEVIADALGRVGRMTEVPAIEVAASPEQGYRMRARLHLRRGRVGFFREGTHDICDAAIGGQLLPDAVRAAELLARDLAGAGLRGDADIELSENVAADERALHVELEADAELSSPQALRSLPGVTGLTWSYAQSRRDERVFGQPHVTDVLGGVRLRRHARAFFQGNRYLLEELTRTVTAACLPGTVLDLYAGVGLFGVCLAAAGQYTVTAVEGHGASVVDLRANAQPYGEASTVAHEPVEYYVARQPATPPGTIILDPPRTGMTKDAAAGAVALGASRIVFVSCDVATFARDVRRLLDAGYRLVSIRGFDLFPGTAHVEAVGVLER
jgi:23S rRNA (uracil1939-C5)-methyltransferase